MTTGPQGSWTILEILRWTTAYFQEKGVSDPRASAEVLLAQALGVSRLDLYLRYDQPLTPEELGRFKALVVRRRNGEPVAYITGHKEFWSLDFKVTPAVLIPRPETETLVAAVLEAVRESGGRGQDAGVRKNNKKNTHPWSLTPGPCPLWCLEVGVGSGAVVVALARELLETEWLAVDLSRAALEVARDNARKHAVAGRIRFFQADLLAGLRPGPRFALLVANLPYVSRREWEQLPRELHYEPRQALLGGEDGLEVIRPLARQAHHYLQPQGWLALEVGPGQAQSVAEILRETEAYDRLALVPDYHGVQRVLRARRAA